ncbi:GNAT family N-acetyltransferase [Dolichospermum sp. ST_sed3]|nr:GNAT family N-acetyltransferase [Dolichospermum sp. ST_sed3]
MEITVRRVAQKDKAEWLRMRKGVWPEAPDEYLDYDMDDVLASDKCAVFFALIKGAPAGLIEVHLRESAEGCFSSPVGYIEAWFVDESLRGKGVSGVLAAAAEDWARGKGCTDMASDTWLDNEASIRAHARMGYSEVERLVHFVKQL